MTNVINIGILAYENVLLSALHGLEEMFLMADSLLGEVSENDSRKIRLQPVILSE